MRSLVVVAVLAGSAHADPQLVPITPGTSYAIDLYDGVTLGNSAVVAMGGATVANAAGSSGTLANPSAPAVRNTTDTDTWSWDYHLDFLDATRSRDFANTGLNGVADHGARMFTGGLSLRVHDWAGAVTASTQTVDVGEVTLPSGAMAPLAGTTLRGRLAIAHWFPSRDIAIGTGAQLASFSIAPDCATSECKALFTIQGIGLEAGGQYIPRWQSWRIGVSVSSAIIGGNVVANNCDPNDCNGLVLPTEVRAPWRFAVGGAYRFADSEWNQVVGGNFRDEPAVTVTADLVVSGPTADGYGLDAFAQNQLERSGSDTVLSLRGGAEYEWLPGRLRVRGGSYWEPGRFDGVSGRIHGTFGVEVRVFDFQLWGQRRGRITLTGDLAHRYNNVAVSIGFWH